jgi:NO-binding membrane sensor protein with MHYT domain
VSQPTLPHLRLLGGGLILGVGIAAMHYTGMAAMRMQPGIDYDPLWFALSIVVAMVTAFAALWIAHHLRSERRRIRRIRLLAALVMGLAVVGMHYTMDQMPTPMALPPANNHQREVLPSLAVMRPAMSRATKEASEATR